MNASHSSNAFQYRPFLFYWLARLLAIFAIQIVVVAIGWKVYDLTHDPLALGYVGLMQFLPALILVLITGTIADRISRRLIIAVTYTAQFGCAVAFLTLSLAGSQAIWPIYLVLLVLGIARAFQGPALQSFVTNLVPKEALATAISWVSSSWQIGTIGGPVLGGLLYGLSERVAFITASLLFAAAIALMVALPRLPRGASHRESTWETLSGGFRFVFSNRIVLGAISLDLFAVLLGGAVALMPVYASDILALGPIGLGLLRSAPGIGAIVMAALLARFPINSGAGIKMFAGVAVFAVATIVFGLSTSPWMSIAALAIMGAGDMVSVYVRETLIQLSTPDALRGRVSAVNMVFIGASNELGEFRAGTMASLIGVIPAVVFGGIGTVAVATIWSIAFPSLRKAERLDGT